MVFDILMTGNSEFALVFVKLSDLGICKVGRCKEGYVFEKLFTIENIWVRLPFFSQETFFFTTCALR